MHCVIGSGPTGVACARALISRGEQVRMLDAGIQLEADRAAVVRGLAACSPKSWSCEDVEALKEGMAPSTKGIPLKRVFGSDFPYREADQHVAARYDRVGLRPSLALGGLSNVWGAAMLPYLDRDLDAWPIKSVHLEEHYRAVLQLTGLSARLDDLAELFPLHVSSAGVLQLSRQAAGLLKRLQRFRARLRAAGVWFGAARLAVQAHGGAQKPGCIYCGLCMYGCPYGCIYNSASTVRELQAVQSFTYQPDIIVTRLRETTDCVHIEGYDRLTGQKYSEEACRVFLAAGVIPTTKLLLQSQGAYEEAIVARDSQYFLFPLVSSLGARGVSRETLYTLSQLFLEICNPRISAHTVHLQIYSYNDLIGKAVRKSFGFLARPLELLAKRLEERLFVVQGYLHSDDSASLKMTLKRGEPGGSDYLQLQAALNPETPRAIRRVLRELLRRTWQLGALPLAPLLQVAEPGRGFHAGGSFPMRAQPQPFESDCLGRPFGWQRVHAVDATVFPSIPATTITLSAMANAHRIGSEAAKLS